MIERALPLEGAPLAEPGPYKVTSEAAFGSPGHLVFHPTTLDAFPKKDTLPVMVWGNGGCAIDTHALLGLSDDDRLARLPGVGHGRSGRRGATTGNRRRLARRDRLGEKENARAGSPLKGKIAMDKVAVMGQSCGGFLSIALGADPRVKTIGVFNSGVQKATPGRSGVAVSRPRMRCPNCTGPCCSSMATSPTS